MNMIKNVNHKTVSRPDVVKIAIILILNTVISFGIAVMGDIFFYLSPQAILALFIGAFFNGLLLTIVLCWTGEFTKKVVVHET